MGYTTRHAAQSGKKQRRPDRSRSASSAGVRMCAMAVPGLAPVVAREMAALEGVSVQDSGFDGRSDVVLLEVERGHRFEVARTGVTEDVFVEVGRTLRADGDNPRWIAERIWRPERVERALSVWAEEVGPLRASMTFRVVVRVLQERSFLRTDLRLELTRAVRRFRPRWRVADPAQLEIWITEYRAGRFVAGLRLSDVRMRQHDGRAAERRGALRPTVAAAMVKLASEPRGLLLDPCCGSGTILAEALNTGWDAQGFDIDREAVSVAQRNVPDAEVQVGDARDMKLPDASVAACVSNLPFGQQYTVRGDMAKWLETVLAEMVRVTVPGGRAVLLVPQISRRVIPSELRLVDRLKIRLLGTSTSIWRFDRDVRTKRR